MKTLWEIEKRVENRKKALSSALPCIVDQLRQMGAIKIILFGSFLSDRIGPSSDLDIFLIMPDGKSGKEWLGEVYSRIDRKVACDFFVFNESEFERDKEISSLIREVLKKGRIVYEKNVS
jgi:predicted nucleotidyltransferase